MIRRGGARGTTPCAPCARRVGDRRLEDGGGAARGWVLVKWKSRVRAMPFLENQFEKNVLVTSVDYVFNWARKSSLWP